MRNDQESPYYLMVAEKRDDSWVTNLRFLATKAGDAHPVKIARF